MSRASLRPALRMAMRGGARLPLGLYFSKATDPGPFATGIQTTLVRGSAQVLKFPRGTQIAGNFYTNFDSNQGWLACWLTPTWDGDDGVDHYIAQWSANGYLAKNAAGNLVLSVASGVTLTVDVSAWNASTTYRVEARWDADNPMDASDNHLGLSIDDSHTFGRTTDYTPEAPAEYIYIGTDNAGANAIAGVLGGLTIYRRPGWDGTAGINMDRGDEIALNADKVYTTGSWDVVFCLPTNATAGALSLAAESWSHPSASNLIAAADGFMTSTAWANWTDEGTPINSAVLTEAQKIYGGGYQYESDAANEGKYIDVSSAAGDRWVVRAIAHSDGTSIPKLILYDQTNGKEIGSVTGTKTSTRQAPDILMFSASAPSNSKAYGTISANGLPNDGDTVTIGTYVYTFKTVLSDPPADEIYVLINAFGGPATSSNLWYAVNGLFPLIDYYRYGANRGIHPDVNGRYTAKVAGAAGNAIALTTTIAAWGVDAAGHLTDGSDDLDCATLRVKLVNTEASGVVYWHEVELLDNLEPDPSFEHGNGDPFTARGQADSQLALGKTSGSATAHSGAASILFTDVCHSGGGCSPLLGLGWYSGGAWAKVEAGSQLWYLGSAAVFHSENNGRAGSSGYGGGVTAADWTLTCGVCRVTTAGYVTGAVLISQAGDTGDKWGDDVYLFPCTAITLEQTL